jgi:N-acetyl-gamma-glutamyl-phosphate reductase
MIDCVILGASGFGGGELLRLLTAHPQVRSVQAVSRSHAGKPLHSVHPNLRATAAQDFLAQPNWSELARSLLPVCFAAMPHGEFAQQYPDWQAQWQASGLVERLTVIDLSGDFRLRDADEFAAAYHRAHPCPQYLGHFVYGLSEFSRAQLSGARRIANPGCFATALALGMLPLADLPREARPQDVAISAITGSSGSGAHLGVGTHHPLRAHDFRAYKMLSHQHEAEVLQTLRDAGWGARFSFVPHSAPLVRGIYATLQFRLASEYVETLQNALRQRYPTGGFVRVLEDAPRLAAVQGSNYVELSMSHRDDRVCVLVALDNLVKGMAGQAVQNMNLSLGLPEGCGLQQLALWPG